MSAIGPGVRAVFFDAVGTLLFPAAPPAETYAAAARRQGVSVDPVLVLSRFRAAFQAEEEADRAAGWVADEDREWERWLRIVATSLPELPDPALGFNELFEFFGRPEAWAVNPDVPKILGDLHSRGIVAGVGSNLDWRLHRIIAGHPVLAPVAERVVISAAVGYRKPSPRFFAEVVRVAGCEPGAILFVGDDLGNDYHGAAAAGLVSVLLTASGQPPDAPRRINRLRDLLA
jgi:putative hydrolase of the HAD superfamily